MNGLIFPVCKLGMLNPPLPDAVGETGVQSPMGLSLGSSGGSQAQGRTSRAFWRTGEELWR